ncbi:MAG: tetratricopeptide repeat protein, partial [Bryobacterales bacterium]|nr:tetratricopeptide repeat protein [Bryobacterales bacterium]
MRSEVESLLAAAGFADSLFQVPAAIGLRVEAAPEPGASVPAMGQQIGPYRLLERLGEGGMGVVFRASQTEPVRREVALKIVRPGLDSALVAARFSAERQALAMMDHPNIARVVDAGTTASDRAYFVMELVRGQSITSYCKTHELSVRQRVELMIPVCRAIQHAHQNGVIHRDIKPSNILIATTGPDGEPVPKVIDFGIAKAAGNPLTEGHAGFTQAFDILGTLEYMSPEQAEPGGPGVDVRSDVYSLGAVLYELLCGQPPMAGLNLREASLTTLLKRIQEETPAPPSQRAGRGSIRGRAVPAECDWIAMKALEKERERRYESPAALGRDLQSYLDGLPVEAGPPSALYRMGKLARRYRAWVATAAVFLLLLISATVVSLSLAVRANRAEQAALAERDRARLAEQRARTERDHAIKAEADAREAQSLTLREKSRADGESATAQAIARFLQDDLLARASPSAQAGPAAAPDPNLTVRTLLERSAGTLAAKFQDQPAVRASLEHTIANAYLDLGLFPQAREHAQQAVELRRKNLGARHPLTFASMDRLALAYRSENQFAAAEKIWQELYEHRRTALGESHPDTLHSMHSLAALYRSQGKNAQAVTLYERVWKIRRQVLGFDHPETMRTANNLAYAYLFVARAAEAAKVHEDNVARRRRVLGPDHPDTLQSMSNLGLAYENQGRYDEARRLLEETLATQRRILGGTHFSVLSTALNLGRVLFGQRRFEEAQSLLREMLRVARESGQEKSPVALTMMNNLGLYYIDGQRPELAVEILGGALAIQRENIGPEHPDTLRTLLNLGNAYRLSRDYTKAEQLILEAVEARRRNEGEDQFATLH